MTTPTPKCPSTHVPHNVFCRSHRGGRRLSEFFTGSDTATQPFLCDCRTRQRPTAWWTGARIRRLLKPVRQSCHTTSVAFVGSAFAMLSASSGHRFHWSIRILKHWPPHAATNWSVDRLRPGWKHERRLPSHRFNRRTRRWIADTVISRRLSPVVSAGCW